MFNFANNLKELRLSLGISQKKIADNTGLSIRAYQHYEYGDREPTMSALIALADYFNVSIDYLVGRTDNQKINL